MFVPCVVARVDVNENDARMAGLLGQRIVEKVADAEAPSLTPLGFDGELPACPPMRRGELAVRRAAVLLVFEHDIESRTNENRGDVHLITCPGEPFVIP